MFFSSLAEAEQLSFNKLASGQSHSFHYRWNDWRNQTHQLDFTIANQALFKRFRNFRGYQHQIASKYFLQTLKKELNKQQFNSVKFEFNVEGDSLEASIKGQDQEALNQASQWLTEAKQRVRLQFLQENFYNEILTHQGELGIKPDHVRIASESLFDLAPVVEQIYLKVPHESPREIINYVLSFVQSIPYNKLESRITSSGSGFNPPTRLLFQNQGDCDSKVTLAATILKSLYPKATMVIVYLPGHALLGIQASYENGEKNIKIGSQHFVLAEPTGPALLPMGEISQESEIAINNGQYVTEQF
jgi:hypothetical protein